MRFALMTTGGSIAHAGRTDLLDKEGWGRTLCGEWAAADDDGQAWLPISGADDLNLNCRRCQVSTVWRFV